MVFVITGIYHCNCINLSGEQVKQLKDPKSFWMCDCKGCKTAFVMFLALITWSYIPYSYIISQYAHAFYITQWIFVRQPDAILF